MPWYFPLALRIPIFLNSNLLGEPPLHMDFSNDSGQTVGAIGKVLPTRLGMELPG
jgi:hypothetical protein